MSGVTEVNVSRKPILNHWLLLMVIHLHVFGIMGLWLFIFEAKWTTVLFVTFLTLISSIGVTIGAHRYFAHRTFEANESLVYFFILAQTLAGVGPLYNWIRSHRLHHKYYQTDNDPYYSHKGFLYNHFWSKMLKSTWSEEELQKKIDMRDIEIINPVVVQKTFYWILMPVVAIIIPVSIATEYLHEDPTIAILTVGFFRLAINFNLSALVNSSILLWGLNPGDKFPIRDNSIFFLNRSYWLNYHYLLPWDWKSTEFGQYNKGFGTLLIKVWKYFDFVELPKTISSEDIRNVLIKIANKDISWEDAVIQLRKQSEEKAAAKKIRFNH